MIELTTSRAEMPACASLRSSYATISLREPIEVVGLVGKRPGDFVAQRAVVVVEFQSRAGESDLRAELRGDGEVVPRESQLPQQPGERAGLRALGRKVGERVQADVVIAAAEAIERVQPADRVVPLEDADTLVVVRQPNPGREAPTCRRR